MKKYLLLTTYYLLLYLPWLPLFLKQLNIGKGVGTGSGWGRALGGMSFKNIVLLPIKFIIGRTSFENKLTYGFIVSLSLIFFTFLLIRARKKSAKAIWSWLILPPLLGGIISFKVPLFSYFRFLFCLPAFYLLIAKGIVSFKNKKVINVILSLVLLINLFFSFRYLFIFTFHRENWQQAVRTLHQKNSQGAPILILQNVSAPFNYYDQSQSRKVYLYQKEAISGFDSVWLIPYALPIFDPQDETRTFLESRGFIRTYEEHFRGVTLEKWEKIPVIGYNIN